MRSIARVYWVKSLVPTEKKSTSWAKASAMSAAEGISIMMPRSTLGRAEFSLHFSHHVPRRPPFGQVCDHGKHDPQRPKFSGAQNGSQLLAQQVGSVQTEADTAFAQERDWLPAHVDVGQRFIAADIQCAHDDRTAVHRLHDIAVHLKLFQFRRRCRCAPGKGTPCAASQRLPRQKRPLFLRRPGRQYWPLPPRDDHLA